jgi:hypothetical protein
MRPFAINLRATCRRAPEEETRATPLPSELQRTVHRDPTRSRRSSRAAEVSDPRGPSAGPVLPHLW